jgi:hypothetical protein
VVAGIAQTQILRPDEAALVDTQQPAKDKSEITGPQQKEVV